MSGLLNKLKDTVNDALQADERRGDPERYEPGRKPGGGGQQNERYGERIEQTGSGYDRPADYIRDSSGYGPQGGSGYNQTSSSRVYGVQGDSEYNRDSSGYGAKGSSEYNRTSSSGEYGVQGGREYNSHQGGSLYNQPLPYEQVQTDSGYGGRGGRSQDPGFLSGSRDFTGGYSQSDAFSRREEGGYQEETSGFGGHGGRSMALRPEERLDSSSLDYRPAQDSGVYPNHSSEGLRVHGAENEEEESLFSRALGMISGREKEIEKDAQHGINEEEMVGAHRMVYNEQGKMNENGIAQAAAVQALKLFAGGRGGGEQDQSAFIGLAMKEASKMFDQQSRNGNLSQSANKQDAVSTAAQMAFKLFLKSKMDAGGAGGGAAGLVSLARKFLGA